MLARLQGLTTEWLLPVLPAALLLFTAGWAGTFQAPLAGPAPGLAFLALAVLASLAKGPWWDPLGLGRWGWSLPGLGLVILVSLWASPVPRAGRLGLAALPLLYLLPSAVRQCWGSEARQRRGLTAVVFVVLGVAGHGLLAAVRTVRDTSGLSWGQALAEARPALPLGHHNLLALWLVALLPLVVAVLVAPGRGWGGWRRRGLAFAATLVALVTLVLSRSLAAAVGLALTAALFAVLRWGWRGALRALAVVVVLLAWQSPRIEAIVFAEDPSTLARQAYWQAGIDGVRERPGSGWGPGSTPWVVARHVEPAPGIHPPHDVVADLHSLPLQLAYELGIPVALGLLLLVVVALWRALGRARRSGDPVAWAGALGLFGLLAASLGGLPLSVLALPVALAIVVATIDPGTHCYEELAAKKRPEGEAPLRPRIRTDQAPLGIALAMGLLALAPGLAQRDYDQAVAISIDGPRADADPDPTVARELRSAIALDPGFPLYRARLAWLEVDTNPGDLDTRRWSARRAHQAAEDAFGVAPLWLVAGALGQEAREPWSREALLRACQLDPLAPMAPFRLAIGGRREPLVEVWAARALVAEPRLLAAEYWVAHPALLRSAVDRVLATDGIDPGWREALAATAERVRNLRGPRRRLVLSLDGDPAQSASLYTFRRQPWPTRLVEVVLRNDAVEAIQLVPATRLRTTDPELFRGEMCGL